MQKKLSTFCSQLLSCRARHRAGSSPRPPCCGWDLRGPRCPTAAGYGLTALRGRIVLPALSDAMADPGRQTGSRPSAAPACSTHQCPPAPVLIPSLQIPAVPRECQDQQSPRGAVVSGRRRRIWLHKQKHSLLLPPRMAVSQVPASRLPQP